MPLANILINDFILEAKKSDFKRSKRGRIRALIFIFFIFNFTLLIGEEVTTEDFIISYHGLKKDFVKKFALSLEDEIDKFQRKLGKYPDYKVKIIIAQNNDDYLKIIKSKLKITEFSRAVYIPSQNLIVIRSPKDIANFSAIRRTLLHEYIHGFIHHHMVNVPLWFNEGMAVYFSNDFGMDRELRFAYSYLLQNPITLTEMASGYPKSKAEWEFYYAKSALAVKYLYTSNTEQFIRFWDNVTPKTNFYQAFVRTYLINPKIFSNQFEKYCRNHFKTQIIMASSSLIWGFLPLLAILVWIRRKVKFKKLYELNEEEKNE